MLIFTVISLSAIVITLGTVLSMIQQINYIIAWKAIKEAAYLNAVARQRNQSYAFITTYNELDTIVFLIRECKDTAEPIGQYNIGPLQVSIAIMFNPFYFCSGRI